MYYIFLFKIRFLEPLGDGELLSLPVARDVFKFGIYISALEVHHAASLYIVGYPQLIINPFHEAR